jgi:hypothetical protein
VSADILIVERLGAKGWFCSNQGRWVKSEDVLLIDDKKYKIEEAFIVEKTLFRSREAALEHLIRIQVFEKMRPVFGGDFLNDTQNAILDTLIDKLLMDRKEFSEILKGEG